jgi:hypothetical protein
VLERRASMGKKRGGMMFKIVTDPEENRQLGLRIIKDLERQLSECTDDRRAAALKRDIEHRRKHL